MQELRNPDGTLAGLTDVVIWWTEQFPENQDTPLIARVISEKMLDFMKQIIEEAEK